MKKISLEVMSEDMARELMMLALEHLVDWPIKTPERFRNAILGEGFFGVNPLLSNFDRSNALFLKKLIQDTVAKGCMIDFGFIPNEVIKEESTRAREVFERGELIHPYEKWLGLSSWEGGSNGYLISPNPLYPDEIVVLELYGVSVPNVGDCIILYDIISIKIAGLNNTILSPHNYKIDQTEQQLKGRASNSLDPMVTMLRLLADVSIPVVRVDRPERLNRVRVRQGKFPIPDHTKVHVKDYITSFKHSASSKSSSKGGTHASPVAHWRKAHLRHLTTGRVIPVRSSKVNFRDQEEMHRLFYKV